MTDTFDDRGLGYKSAIPEATGLTKVIANLAPQAALVLEYLQSGRGLSGLIAHTVLGVTSLTTRVAELRKLDLPITGRWHTDIAGKRFMVYRWEPGKEARDEGLQNVPHPQFTGQ